MRVFHSGVGDQRFDQRACRLAEIVRPGCPLTALSLEEMKARLELGPLRVGEA